jgi:hypothetical protein
VSRVAGWYPAKFDDEFRNLSMDVLRDAAQIIAANVRARCPVHEPVGVMYRPVYKTGKAKGQPWTARTGGTLKKSIRVTERYEVKGGTKVWEDRNIRVYAGHYMAYYARIVEKIHPTKALWMRKGFTASLPAIRSLVNSTKKAA